MTLKGIVEDREFMQWTFYVVLGVFVLLFLFAVALILIYIKVDPNVLDEESSPVI